LRRHPLLLIDGAHNPHGMEALVASLDEEFTSIDWVAVVGAMQDKDLSMFELLDDQVEHVVCTTQASDRAVPAEELAAQLRPAMSATIHAEPEPITALGVARELVGETGGVVVTGSLYLVGDLRRDLGTAG